MRVRTTNPHRRATRRGALAFLTATTVATSGVLATTAFGATEPSGSITLVAYSTPAPAYTQLISDFQKTAAGAGVTVSPSYGASGTQARAVAAGLPADVVNFSLLTDMERLVPKYVPTTWNSDPVTGGMVTDSVVVFVVPKGNPDHIEKWSDLLKPNVRVFTPSPFSSGSARWNIMAAFGAELKLGNTQQGAINFVTEILKKTVVQGASAADELTAFLNDAPTNKGDVLLDYESDAIQAKRLGAKISYVIPPQTLLIENPIAVVQTSKNLPAAQAFVNFLLSKQGQADWANLGYRSVLPAVEAKFRKKYPDPKGLFKIGYFPGGWDTVATQYFSTSASSPGIITLIEEQLGVSTSS
jgi:sulfate transport system substrate-binding protein